MQRVFITGRSIAMNDQVQRGKFSPSLLLFEFRNVTGNPYVHIFGIGMPVLLAVIFGRVLASQIPNAEILSTAVTSIFLGTGAMIPLAIIFIGYAATYSQELEKGIPQRLELFGIDAGMTIINRIISELAFLVCSFVIYFAVGILVLDIKAPTASGLIWYIVCIVVLGIISFSLAHAIALFFKKFGVVYSIVMMLYFGIMIVSGMMGISYEMLPSAVQVVARLLPTMYIQKDFADIWLGKGYNFMPMLQAYLFTGALSCILLLISLKRNARKIARQ